MAPNLCVRLAVVQILERKVSSDVGVSPACASGIVVAWCRVVSVVAALVGEQAGEHSAEEGAQRGAARGDDG